MDLPKIRKEDLPQQLREIVGDNDAEFDAIVDPMDVMILPEYDEDKFMQEKDQMLRKLKEHTDTLTGM
tara:strand:+ start:867 stop:1070 length:204 start_codon:yes stop_codon:yes gene_type:complete